MKKMIPAFMFSALMLTSCGGDSSTPESSASETTGTPAQTESLTETVSTAQSAFATATTTTDTSAGSTEFRTGNMTEATDPESGSTHSTASGTTAAFSASWTIPEGADSEGVIINDDGSIRLPLITIE